MTTCSSPPRRDVSSEGRETTLFGATLRRYRNGTNGYPRLSQMALAERADYDHSYLSRLEAGHRLPTRTAVNRLADALRLDPDEREELLLSAGFAEHDTPLDARLVELSRRRAELRPQDPIRVFLDRQIDALVMLVRADGERKEGTDEHRNDA